MKMYLSRSGLCKGRCALPLQRRCFHTRVSRTRLRCSAEPMLEQFPRLKERDPYRLLGVSRDAGFEEIQETRNFLYETYKDHADSREAIEGAFDRILKEDWKDRQKYGFRPPRTNKKGDKDAEPVKKSILQQMREKLDPEVTSANIVNDGVIFLALGLWAAIQSRSADPTLPLGASIVLCVWRTFDKRKKRNPDGPYFGNSPIWGALGQAAVALVFGGLVSWAVAQYFPLPVNLRPEAVGLFLVCIILGVAGIFLR